MTPLEAGQKIQLRGERVALAEVDEVNDTGLELPKSAHKQHVLCQVVSVGDCKFNGEQKIAYTSAGDVILIQMNPQMVKSMAQKVGEVPLFVVHQGDCIARIENRIINFDNFFPLGRWVLVRVEFEKMLGGLELPEPDQLFGGTAQSYFYFERAGILADLDIPRGHQVYVDKTRVNVLKLNGKKYAYLDKDSVVGIAVS